MSETKAEIFKKDLAFYCANVLGGIIEDGFFNTGMDQAKRLDRYHDREAVVFAEGYSEGMWRGWVKSAVREEKCNGEGGGRLLWPVIPRHWKMREGTCSEEELQSVAYWAGRFDGEQFHPSADTIAPWVPPSNELKKMSEYEMGYNDGYEDGRYGCYGYEYD